MSQHSEKELDINLSISFINQGDVLTVQEVTEIFIDFNRQIRNLESIMRKSHTSLKLSLSRYFIEKMGGKMYISKSQAKHSKYNMFIRLTVLPVHTTLKDITNPEQFLVLKQKLSRESLNFNFIKL
jgi:K+-sensing histidine kinase KdpD